jgi:hypothetical protein
VKLLSLAAVLVGGLALSAPSAWAAQPKPVDFELAPPAPAGATAAGHGAVVSRALRTPRRFNLVGLRWRGAAKPGVKLRVRRRGRWSRWARLDTHSDHNPDVGQGEPLAAGSDPIWVRRAGAVQYRLSRQVSGLRLHFVDLGVNPARRARARAAQAPPPTYVSRKEWGASKCPPRGAPEYGTVRAVNVHHTVSLNDYSPEESPSIVLAICRYHRNSNGWDDIGYNALVDKYGTLFEGRAGGLDQPIVGAQAQGFNSQTAGISNIGDYSSVEQTPEALATLANYIRWKLTVHGQPLSGRVTLVSAGGPLTKYAAGTRATIQRVAGHRDTGRTACPGNALYAQLPQLRALVETGTTVNSSATRLSAALSDYRADFGTDVSVSGALLAPDGLPLAGERIHVQVSSEGHWKRARRVLTGPDGAFFTDLKPRRRMYVRVRYLGRTGLRRATSQRLLLQLRPLITLDEPPSVGVRRELVEITGSVGPRKRRLSLVVQKLVRGRYRKDQARTVRARRGRFATSFTPRRAGVYRYYVVSLPDLDTDRGASQRQVVRVSR